MIHSSVRRAVLLTMVIAIVATAFGNSSALQATPVGTLASSILNETPGNVPVSMLVRNLGPHDDMLIGASSPIATRVELHHSSLVAGVRVMEPVDGGVPLPAGSTTIFEPESEHLMLIGTSEPLVQGGSFPIELHFQHAGEVSATGRVRRKVDAAGVTPIPPVVVGDLDISLVSAPPAPAAHRP